MTLPRFLASLLLLVTFLAVSGVAQDSTREIAVDVGGAPVTDKRVALVVGNNSYPKLLPDNQLTTAVNDARSALLPENSSLSVTAVYAP